MYDYDSNNYVLLLESVKLPSDVKRHYSTNVKLTNTTPKGGDFMPVVLVENGYRLCSFWSGVELVFKGTTRVYERSCCFNFNRERKKERKKEEEICKFEMDFKKSFLLLF